MPANPAPGSCAWVISLTEALAEHRATPAGVLAAILDEVESECPVCREALAEYPRALLLARAGGDYEAAVAAEVAKGSARAVDLARERAEAPEQIESVIELDRLLDVNPVLAVSPHHHRWGLAMQMLEVCESLVLEDPQSALAWGRVGLTIATALDPARYGRAVVADARAVAHSHVARASLAGGGRLGDARGEVMQAEALAAGGTGSPMVALEVAATQLELEVAGGSWREAVGCYERLMGSPALAASPRLVLRVTMALARAYVQGGLPELALRALRGVVRASDASPGEELLAMSASLDLVALLCDMGLALEAAAQLAHHKVRFVWQGPARLAGRALWMDARVLAVRGKAGAALLACQAARLQLLAAGDPLSAARAAVDHLLLLESVAAAEAAAPRAQVLAWLPDVLETPGLPRWAATVVLRLLRVAHAGGHSMATLEMFGAFLAKPSASYSGGVPAQRPVVN